MANNRIPLEANKVYHYYNHAVGNEKLFFQPKNYDYFLKKYAEHLHGIFETYCYCLLPNHFHFLVRVRSEEELSKVFGNIASLDKPLSDKLAHKVGSFQNAYAKAINIQENRKGGLFIQSFPRKLVKSSAYFSTLVHYIHGNAVHHGFVEKVEDWEYSSYHSYLSHKKSRLNREEIFEYFGNRQAFIDFHTGFEFEEKLVLAMEDFN